MRGFAKTRDAIALEFKVHPRTVASWMKLPRFPRKTRRGWNLQSVHQFLREHGLGPYRRLFRSSSPLAEARLRDLETKTAIAKIRQQKEGFFLSNHFE